MTNERTIRKLNEHGTMGEAGFAASVMALFCVLAGGASSEAQAQAKAQSAAGQMPVAAEAEAEARLPALNVTGAADTVNTLTHETGMLRMPDSIQSTPQAITVIPQQMLEQQVVTTLDQALRNTPGITATIGEGNGGVQGDQFRIRGFNAQNDIYADGLKDFGSHTRDAFNYQEVQVLKGPSAITFGPGNVGGAINVITKTPHLGDSFSAEATGGMGPFGRGVIDWNKQLGATSAARLDVMGNANSVVGRDMVKSGRWAVAPSFAWGIGTDTVVRLDYLHQYDNRTPDYGVPFVTAPGQTVGTPITEHGVSRNTWYGFDTDHDVSTVDRVTAHIEHRFADWLTVSNDTRLLFMSRDFAATPTSCSGACATAIFDGNPSTVPFVSVGGPGPYTQDTWAVQNLTSGLARFNTGFLRHQLTAGVDYWSEHDSRTNGAYSVSRGSLNAFFPDHNGSFYSVVPNTTNTAQRQIDTSAVGVFVVDRIWLLPELSVIGGFRWNQYNTQFDTWGPGSPRSSLVSNNSIVNPRASVIYEPTSTQTYYFSYATTSSPAGQYIATQPGSFTAGNAGLAPEQSESYEVGAKFGLLNNRLGLSGSLFQINKNNAITSDPDTGTITQSGDKQRVRGFEVLATGQILPHWIVNAGYAYLDGTTVASTTAGVTGKQMQYVARHNVTLWTSYDYAPETPWNLTVGGGMIYTSPTYSTTTDTTQSPYYLSFDAMMAHKLNKNWKVAVNLYNLTDRLNYTTAFNSRVTPAPGRTVLFSVSMNY